MQFNLLKIITVFFSVYNDTFIPQPKFGKNCKIFRDNQARIEKCKNQYFMDEQYVTIFY